VLHVDPTVWGWPVMCISPRQMDRLSSKPMRMFRALAFIVFSPQSYMLAQSIASKLEDWIGPIVLWRDAP